LAQQIRDAIDSASDNDGMIDEEVWLIDSLCD
jgi:hypothetical protein